MTNQLQPEPVSIPEGLVSGLAALLLQYNPLSDMQLIVCMQRAKHQVNATPTRKSNNSHTP
jgi:hypothetical protein